MEGKRIRFEKARFGKAGIRIRLLFSVLVSILVSSCQTFPAGEPIGTVVAEEGYTFADLQDYFEMSRSAWRERETYRDTGWDLHYFGDEETHILAVAIPEGNTLYIAFRGSQVHRHPRDVLMVGMFGRRRVPFGENSRITAHRGFLLKYLALRDEIHQLIDRFDRDKVMLLGHSAGGSVAALAYMDLLPRYPDREIRAVTFGMPRTFNRHGAEWFGRQESQFLRIVMGRDLVVGLPPAWLGYRHAGRLVRMGRRSLILPFSLRDHWPGYQNELADLVDETDRAE